MSILYIICICLTAYLAGSIPTSIWAGKLFHGIDVREHGSGNAGATNTIRVLGWKTGVPVLLIDIFKGWFAASLPVFLAPSGMSSTTILNYQMLAGLIAVTGHILPLFAGFRGGKGVATTFGFLLALNPTVTMICLGIFMAVLLGSGYVSLSSIAAGIGFPILVFTLFDTPSVLFRYFSVLVAVAIIATHQKNIVRLLHGEENKFIRKKSRSDGH